MKVFSDHMPVLKHCALFAGVVVLAACMAPSGTTRPGIPSPTGSPTSTPPTGIPGGNPSDGLPDIGTTTTLPGGNPFPSRTPGTEPGTAGDRTIVIGKSRDSDGKSDAGTEGKSDDEILAEALEQMEGRKVEPADGEPQPGQQPAAGREGTVVASASDRSSGLDAALDDKFAEFDRAMLSERDSVRKSDDADGNRGFNDRDTYEADDQPDAEAAMSEALKTAMAERGERNDSGRPDNEAGPASDSTSRIPADLVSADGDDIIARQLREAAMKERDPELQAKLWDEYRKYKRGG
jgi:hypothetical protein